MSSPQENVHVLDVALFFIMMLILLTFMRMVLRDQNSLRAETFSQKTAVPKDIQQCGFDLVPDYVESDIAFENRADIRHIFSGDGSSCGSMSEEYNLKGMGKHNQVVIDNGLDYLLNKSCCKLMLPVKGINKKANSGDLTLVIPHRNVMNQKLVMAMLISNPLILKIRVPQSASHFNTYRLDLQSTKYLNFSTVFHMRNIVLHLKPVFGFQRLDFDITAYAVKDGDVELDISFFYLTDTAEYTRKKDVSRIYGRVQKRPWVCLQGINVPLRKNADGNVECMSTNKKDCMWRNNNVDCMLLAKSPPHNVEGNSLECGEMHRVRWGGTGYGGNHWCQHGMDQIGTSNNNVLVYSRSEMHSSDADLKVYTHRLVDILQRGEHPNFNFTFYLNSSILDGNQSNFNLFYVNYGRNNTIFRMSISNRTSTSYTVTASQGNDRKTVARIVMPHSFTSTPFVCVSFGKHSTILCAIWDKNIVYSQTAFCSSLSNFASVLVQQERNKHDRINDIVLHVPSTTVKDMLDSISYGYYNFTNMLAMV